MLLLTRTGVCADCVYSILAAHDAVFEKTLHACMWYYADRYAVNLKTKPYTISQISVFFRQLYHRSSTTGIDSKNPKL